MHDPKDIVEIALLGQAVGDAFGAPFEFHPEAPQLARRSMTEQRYLDGWDDCGIRKAYRCRLPGLYTDDTQQALVLVQARASGCGIADAPGFVRGTFKRMAQTEPELANPNTKASFGIHRGTGGNFRESVNNGPPPSAGLGAAMRVGPVATMFDDPQEMVDWVFAVSQTTTTHPVALACAVRYAAVVWASAHLRHADLRRIRWPDEVPGAIWAAATQSLKVLGQEGEEGLLELARSTGWSNKGMWCAANGFALTGVAWALYHGLKASCFQEALIGVCASGGDTDTVASMAGCLAAVRFGVNDIPYWMVKDLVGRATLTPGGWTIEAEKTLTEMDAQYRLRFTKKPPEPEPVRDFFEEAQTALQEDLDPVLFYGPLNPNGEFSNFYLAEFELDGQKWQTVEHYYVAQKAPRDPIFQGLVRQTRSPGQAKRLGQTIDVRPNWDNIKFGVMLRAVRAKFSQNPKLRSKLLATGDRFIHENSKDPWWGGGPNYKGGKDWLGQILMQIRQELRA